MTRLMFNNDGVTGFSIFETQPNQEYLYIEWDILDTDIEQEHFVIRKRYVLDFEIANYSTEYKADKLEIVEHIGFNDCNILEVFKTVEELKERLLNNFNISI